MDVEKELMSLDFRKFSKVEDSLLNMIIVRRKQRRATENVDELTDDELYSVSAAGMIPPKKENQD